MGELYASPNVAARAHLQGVHPQEITLDAVGVISAGNQDA
jgi:hypothetical protein